jgi:hypothetical protein
MGAGRTSFRVEVLGAAKDHTLARYSRPSFSDMRAQHKRTRLRRPHSNRKSECFNGTGHDRQRLGTVVDEGNPEESLAPWIANASDSIAARSYLHCGRRPLLGGLWRTGPVDEANLMVNTNDYTRIG